MTQEERFAEFRRWQDLLGAYRMALTLIGIDDNAGAPSQGASYRGARRALLTGEFRKLQKDDRMFEIVQRLYEDGGLDDDRTREVELVYRQMVREREVPAEAYVEFEQALDRSRRDWPRAKYADDYKGFAPLLQEVADAYRNIVSLRQGEGSLYDRMLDERQPGWNRSRYDAFFAQVKECVLPIVRESVWRELPDFLQKDYPVETQRRVMNKVLDYMGFTPDWGRISESEHPLTTGICRGDVRFTTKYRLHNPALAILSSIHESGHAWYNHQIDPAYEGTMIARSISAGMHESQSRLCENHIGRSRSFWEVFFPVLQEAFPEQLQGVTTEDFYHAVNAVRPSLIRTEADEVTYPLHIIIRYEIEREWLEGRLDVRDLEDVWKEKYQEYLGVTPANAAEGILQDMHWPYAYFGYFPTYALGSALAAQFWKALSAEIPAEEWIRTGRVPELMQRLGERLQRYGNRYEMDELVIKATGKPFTADDYCEYLQQKYTCL